MRFTLQPPSPPNTVLLEYGGLKQTSFYSGEIVVNHRMELSTLQTEISAIITTLFLRFLCVGGENNNARGILTYKSATL